MERRWCESPGLKIILEHYGTLSSQIALLQLLLPSSLGLLLGLESSVFSQSSAQATDDAIPIHLG